MYCQEPMNVLKTVNSDKLIKLGFHLLDVLSPDSSQKWVLREYQMTPSLVNWLFFVGRGVVLLGRYWDLTRVILSEISIDFSGYTV